MCDKIIQLLKTINSVSKTVKFCMVYVNDIRWVSDIQNIFEKVIDDFSHSNIPIVASFQALAKSRANEALYVLIILAQRIEKGSCI